MKQEPTAPDRVGMAFPAFIADHQSPAVNIADYPKDALKRAEHGNVFLHVNVSDSGQVLDVSVRQSSGSSDLDRAALEAIRAARFSPALKDQKPVNSSTDVVVAWVLPGPGAPASLIEQPAVKE